MKTASLFFPMLFYEKCKLADFHYEHTDLVDKAISSTVVCATSGAPQPHSRGGENSSTKTEQQL